jgi:hypothetical protein
MASSTMQQNKILTIKRLIFISLEMEMSYIHYIRHDIKMLVRIFFPLFKFFKWHNNILIV